MPLLQAGYDAALPRSTDDAAVEPTSVALDKTGGLLLNGPSTLLAGRSDRLVLFDAEDDAGYADAGDILDAIRHAGERIGVGLSPA